MKFLLFLISLLFLIFVGAFLYLSYLGFVPVVSTVLGTDKPKNLGVGYSKKEFRSYVIKAGTQIIEMTDPTDAAHSIRYEGRKDLTESFTQEEISARLNYATWRYMPTTNTQVLIHDDGTIEFSGTVLMNRLDGFIARVGMGKYSRADVEKGLSYIGLLKVNPPIYAKAKASVTDNKPSISVENIQVGKFNVPLGTVHANEVVTAITQTIMSQVDGLYAKSVSFANGKMNFTGTVPERMTVEFAK